jgi:hypothetical protein
MSSPSVMKGAAAVCADRLATAQLRDMAFPSPTAPVLPTIFIVSPEGQLMTRR